MKKKYMFPQTEVTEIELQQMIADSITKTLDPSKEEDDVNEVGSRRHSSTWNDDFDDDEE